MNTNTNDRLPTFEEYASEMSISKSQQHLFGAAHAVRSGKKKISDVKPEGFKKQVEKIVNGKMSDEQIEDFAKTSTKKLPDKKK